MKLLLLATVLALVPITSYADEKADIAIKVDLIKADLALSEHHLDDAVNALSDATKYLPEASNSVVRNIAEMNEKVRAAIQEPKPEPKPAAKPQPHRQVRTSHLGYRDPKLWPYPGGVSAAVHPNEHIKEYPVPFVPNTARLAPKTDHILGWYAQDANGNWVWLSEAPPVEQKPSPPQENTLKQLLTEPYNKTWTSYPYPH